MWCSPWCCKGLDMTEQLNWTETGTIWWQILSPYRSWTMSVISLVSEAQSVIIVQKLLSDYLEKLNHCEWVLRRGNSKAPGTDTKDFDGKELANYYRERGWEKKDGGISLSNYFSPLGRISVLFFFPRNSLFYWMFLIYIFSFISEISVLKQPQVI